MNKIFSILIMFVLMLPVYAVDEQGLDDAFINKETTEAISNEELSVDNTGGMLSDNAKNIISEQSSEQYKKPIGKKKIIKKFLIAMLCVAGASIILYGTLSVYNKIREDFIAPNLTPFEGEHPLDMPQDITESVKNFVEKTHWEG